LNRLFSGSILPFVLTCQYPIQITLIDIPTFLGPEDQAIVSVDFTNISARAYGTYVYSAGSVDFVFSTHHFIKILPIE